MSKQPSANQDVATATVEASGTVRGCLEVPGDKSISHRVALLSALASGTSTISGFLQSEDCVNTLRALEGLGVESNFEEDALVINGTGGQLEEPRAPLDLGNSGTGIRLVAGLLAGQPFDSELTGDASLSKRPMGRIREPLEQMGATIELTGDRGTPPIRIRGGGLRGIDYPLPVASAQVKSCILLATLFADGETVVTEPRPTRDHTERLMSVMDIPVSIRGPRVHLQGSGAEGPVPDPVDWYVPGDFSSAAFWLVAAAGAEGRSVGVQNVGLNPRRTALLSVLERMGARVTVERVSTDDMAEPYGDIKVCGTALKATEVSGNEIPNLIDELPLVAVLGALAQGETRIRDAAELRVKESDRIATVVTNLRALGVDVEEHEDGMTIRGPTPVKATGPVKSYGDHRIAMAMAMLGLYADGPVVIEDIACTETSYPGFWGDLKRLGAHVTF